MSDPFDDLERQLVRRVQDAVPPRRASRRRWLSGPLAATLVMGALGGIAYAAIELLPGGTPVPSAPASAPPGSAEARARVILTTADPAGGPDWGLAVFRPSGGSAMTCYFAARTQLGVLGVVGVAGAFGDDRRFHPLETTSSKTMSCGGGDPEHGQFIAGGGATLAPASGFSGAPDTRVGGRPVAGCAPPAERLAAGQARCRAEDVRSLKLGFAGGDVVRVTYANQRVRLSQRPPKGSAGAYLFVTSPADVAGGGKMRLSITYADGSSCTEPLPRRSRGVPSACPRLPRTREPQPLLDALPSLKAAGAD